MTVTFCASKTGDNVDSAMLNLFGLKLLISVSGRNKRVVVLSRLLRCRISCLSTFDDVEKDAE
jgi:hypothetical protein